MSSRAVCVLLSCCLLSGRVSLGDESAPARAAADALNAIKAAGTACPPSWSNASVDKVERLDLPSGLWHLAHVTAAGQRAGYVLLWESHAGFVPVMYSGSSFPAELSHAVNQPTTGNGIHSGPSFVGPTDHTWMIGQCELDSAEVLKPFAPGSLACCLASVLGAVQWPTDKSPLLFLGDGEQYGGYWARLEPHLAAAGLLKESIRGDTARRGGSLSTTVAMERARVYSQEKRRLRQQMQKSREDTDNASPADARGKGYVPSPQDFDVLVPIISAQIANRISPFERFLLLKDEESTARCIGRALVTEGTSRAVYLNRAYLTKQGLLDDAVNQFAVSRGLRVTLVRKRVADVDAGDLPCVLKGPDDQSVVLTALSRNPSGAWGIVIVPGTVLPKKATVPGLFGPPTLADASSQPASAPSVSSEWAERMKRLESQVAQLPPEVRRQAEAAQQELAKLQSTTTSLTDPTSELPGCLDRGAHVLNVSILAATWETIIFSNWAVADNWDLD